MTVFKGFLGVFRRNLFFVIIMTGIMLGMGLVAFQSQTQSSGSFSEDKPSVLLINQGEDTSLTRAFDDYLAKRSTRPNIPRSEIAVNDALYYQELSYAVYLPEDFTAKVLCGEAPTLETKSRGTASSATAQALVSRFMSLAVGYGKYSDDEAEVVEKIESSSGLSTEVELTSQLDVETLSYAAAYYNFGSYTLMAGIMFIISMVLASFAEVSVRRRMIVSSARSVSIDSGLFAGSALVAVALVALNIGLVSALMPGVWDSGRGGHFAINVAVFGLVSLAIGFLIYKITSNREALSAIVNVLALASAFLCGAFIPQELLPDSVLAVGRALPSFYYISNNNALAEMASFSSSDASEFWVNIAIQVGFALVFFVAAVVIGRLRRRES